MELVVDNGKVLEPTKFNKIKAALSCDDIVNIVLPVADVQQIIVNYLWGSCEWLQKYNLGYFSYDKASGSYVVRFTINKEIEEV